MRTPPMSVDTNSGLTLPDNVRTVAAAEAKPPTRQQLRQAARQAGKAVEQLDAAKDRWAAAHGSGVPVAGSGDLRVIRCGSAEHPFHVLQFCANHMVWEPMADENEVAAFLIAKAIEDATEPEPAEG